MGMAAYDAAPASRSINGFSVLENGVRTHLAHVMLFVMQG
jgi:hypothetical protein